MKRDAKAFQGLIEQTVRTLREELRHHRRFRDLVRAKKESLLRETPQELECLYRKEREVVNDLVILQRDRIALLTEIGQHLGHPTPSKLRIAELVLHAHPEDRDELLDLRDEFRDVADDLDDLGAVEPLFSRHRQEHVRLYVSPRRMKNLPAGKQGRKPRRPAVREEN
jgi:hypothetical protein